jgi:hypothetical protein
MRLPLRLASLGFFGLFVIVVRMNYVISKTFIEACALGIGILVNWRYGFQ